MNYINDFLYIVIRPSERGEIKSFLYCAGVNGTKFLPLTRGKHGQGSNPAIRGLQLVRAGIMDMALSRGGKAKKCSSKECGGITESNDTWYTDCLLIEGVDNTFPQDVIKYSVINLIQKIANALRIEDKMPKELLEPKDLQRFIEKLCIRYGE